MFLDFQYAYLIFNLFFFLIWMTLFVIRHDLRKKMLIMSCIIAPLGFTQYFFLDYWHPTYSLGTLFGIVGGEDILWSFFIGGITAVLYEEIFGIRYAKRHEKNHIYWMAFFSAFGIGAMFVGNIILGINSIYVSIIVSMFVGLFIIAIRHDLIKDALFSSLLTGGLMFIFYILFFNIIFKGIVQEWWMLHNLSGISIFKIPIEELMWVFSWGFVAGPTYEFVSGLRFRKT